MRHLLLLLSIFACLLLNACMGKYIEPSQGEVASLKIVNNSNLFLSFTTFEDGSTCKGWQELLPPKDKIALNDRDLKQFESFSINIRADQEFSLKTVGIAPFAGRRGCETILTFSPQLSQSYETIFSSDEGTCSLRVLRVSQIAGTKISEPEKTLKQREIIPGITNSGSICK